MSRIVLFFLFTLSLSSSLPAFAASPFNGVYCGRGTFTLRGHEHSGTKTLEIVATDDSLQLKRDRITLDGGGYIEGRPEEAQIANGKIIYQNKIVGTISEDEIHVADAVTGYEIEYSVKNLGADQLSYSRTSVTGSSRMEENFPTLSKSSPCR